MAYDFLKIIQEVRGTGAPEAAYTDGIYWDITQKLYNGNDGIYGDILAIHAALGGRDFQADYEDFLVKYENFLVEYTDFDDKYADFPIKYADFLIKYEEIVAQDINYIVSLPDVPDAAYDSDAGYFNGTRGLTTTTGRYYMCTDAAVGAAVWVEVVYKINYALDSTDGYPVGSTYIADVTGDTFTSIDDTPTATVWLNSSAGILFGYRAPTINDDFGDLILPNYLWKDLESGITYKLIDGTIGQSRWSIAGTGIPTETNDVTEGYEIGSYYSDLSSNISYVCLDNTAGTALWITTGSTGGQYLGEAVSKSIMFTAKSTGESLILPTDHNALVIDSLEVTGDGSIELQGDAVLVIV